MKHKTRILLKDLFGHYQLSFENPSEGFLSIDCQVCGSSTPYHKETQLFAKLKHKPDCPVAIMRNRIREVINEDKVEE